MTEYEKAKQEGVRSAEDYARTHTKEEIIKFIPILEDGLNPTSANTYGWCEYNLYTVRQGIAFFNEAIEYLREIIKESG